MYTNKNYEHKPNPLLLQALFIDSLFKLRVRILSQTHCETSENKIFDNLRSHKTLQ